MSEKSSAGGIAAELSKTVIKKGELFIVVGLKMVILFLDV